MNWVFSFILFLVTISLFGQSVYSEIDIPSEIDTGLYITGGSTIGIVIDNNNVASHLGLFNRSQGIRITSGDNCISATSTYVNSTALYARSLGGGYAIYGRGNGPIRAAIYGENSLGNGVHGESEVIDGAGIYGENSLGSGVFGTTSASGGVGDAITSGVKGIAERAIGVYGESANVYGVLGRSTIGGGVVGQSEFGSAIIAEGNEGVGISAYSRESVAARFTAFSPNEPDIEFPRFLDSRGIISSDRGSDNSNLELWSNDDLTVVVDRDNSANTGSFQVQNSNGVNLLHVHELNGTDIRGNIEMKSVGGDDNGIFMSDRAEASSDLIIDSNDDIVLMLDANGGEDGQLRVEDTGNTVIFRLFESGNLNIAGTLNQGSDRNRKHHIMPVNAKEVISKIAELPLFNWKYIGEDIGHIGPMAQDFYKAFGLGQGETTISSVDADGVALVAIKELHQQNSAQQSEIDALRQEIAELRTLLIAQSSQIGE